MRFTIFQESRKGSRKVNQDRIAYTFSRDALLLVVADGMGGHAGGEIAAQICVRLFIERFQQEAKPVLKHPVQFLQDSMQRAHAALGSYAAQVAEAKGRFYSIIARQADAVNTITIEDNKNDSECWLGDIVLDGKCDRALLYCHGLAWHPVGNPGDWPGFSSTAAPGTSQAPTTLEPTASGTTAAPQTTLAPTTS